MPVPTPSLPDPSHSYAAMRRYYTQGGVLTGAKYLFIGLAYGVCLVITFIGTAVITINQ